MKLQAIDIFGYGKFVHRQFQLTDDFNVFLGPNGSGKIDFDELRSKYHVRFPQPTP